MNEYQKRVLQLIKDRFNSSVDRERAADNPDVILLEREIQAELVDLSERINNMTREFNLEVHYS